MARKPRIEPVRPYKPADAGPVAKVETVAPEAPKPVLSPIEADVWAEHMRRSMNTFLGVVRHARIQGSTQFPAVAPEPEWLGLFESWKVKMHG
jgi:hypothetical protein